MGSGQGEIPRMFSRIAARYDLANHVLSGLRDQAWRRTLVQAAEPKPGERVLDVCTGTGDLLLEFWRKEPQLTLWGLDLSRGMLTVAQSKLQRLSTTPHLQRSFNMGLIEGDALQLPFPSSALDIVSIAFGLRNLPSYPQGLREMTRVLRPGGRLLVLEFGLPAAPWLRGLYGFYLKNIVPRVGGWLTGDPPAYEYLHRSICEFPPPEQITAWMEEGGLTRAQARPLTGGIVYLYRGERAS
jgi:demethylmenaquinone methyltransferase/2-methoxy-6-polyprenyl-1,4-benzoquinol methylase